MTDQLARSSVFISYSSRDREDAFRIKEILESGGITVWLDFFDIQVASALSKQLVEKVRDAQVFCLLLSPNAVASPWVQKEIEAALEAARAQAGHVQIFGGLYNELDSAQRRSAFLNSRF